MAKKRAVNYEAIPEREVGDMLEPLPWKILNRLLATTHERLANATIALAWRKRVQPNADGQIKLGEARRATDLARCFHDADFVIALNQEAWDDVLTPEQQTALIDHELCHCELVHDDEGNPKRDEKDRLVTRLRRHDIEEFREVVERHGLYKADLEAFAEAARKE